MPHNCCSRPDAWTNNGRWQFDGVAKDTVCLGVCVSCASIVIRLGRHQVALVPDSLLYLRRNYPAYYEELTMEQRCIRESLTSLATVLPPTALRRLELTGQLTTS
jgi:hypothetical protein